MRAQKHKNGGMATSGMATSGATGDFFNGLRWQEIGQEIESDVFELWIGISRLMARVQGAHGRMSTNVRDRTASGRNAPASRSRL